MRVGIIYLGKSGGICQYTYELAKAMSARAEVAVYIAPQNARLDDYRSLPCSLRVIDFKRGQMSLVKSLVTGGEARRIAEEILAESPDVVLDTGSAGWCNAVMKFLSGRVKTAAVIHDVLPHPGWQHFKETLPLMACPLKSDAVVLLSHFACLQAEKQFGKKARIESRHGIILGRENIDLDRVAADRKRLLFFGRIDPYKGIEYLVDAYEMARQAVPDLCLTIAGSGEISDCVRGKIAANGISLINRYVTEEEASELFAGHGLVVLPYTSATQSGVAAAALANGLPAIATNTGALSEQIIDGLNGRIVAPADAKALAGAMVEMVSDEAKFREMAQESLKLGQTVYSWDSIAQKLLDDLEKLAKEGK